MNSPNTENYILGRGILYFDQFDVNGNKQGELDLGNCNAFTLNLAVTKLEHYSMRAGLRVKDKEVVQELNATGSFTLDEYSKDNLVLALFGEAAKEVQAVGNAADEAVTAKLNRWMKLEHRRIDSVVVTDVGDTVTYVENTDYRVDAVTGRILIIDGGAITEGKGLEVDYNYSDINYDKVKAFMQNEVKGFLRFVGDPAVGPVYEVEIWKCSIAPDGDIPFLSEEWGSINFTVSIEKDETGHASNPYFQIIERTADFGTTTTT